MMKKIILMGLLALASGSAFADLAPSRTATGTIAVDANKPYRLEAEAGYSVYQTKSDSSAKTKKENLNVLILGQRQVGKWGQEIRAEAISSNDDSATSNTEQYYLSGKLLHRSSPTVYQFAKVSAEKDLGSAFDYQASAIAGIGKDIIKDQKQHLSVELGAGARYSKERYAPKDTHTEAIGSIAGFYQYQVNSAVRFNQDLSYEFGKDTRTLRSRTALSADLTNKISAVASYNIKDLKADAGDSRTSLLSLGVRYKF